MPKPHYVQELALWLQLDTQLIRSNIKNRTPIKNQANLRTLAYKDESAGFAPWWGERSAEFYSYSDESGIIHLSKN